MLNPIQGLHHITAITNDAQENLNFYSWVLGLKIVKITVNFEDPGTYHIYYGDSTGSPGSIVAFYPWKNVQPAQPGYGQAISIAFLVPPNSIGFWKDHLNQKKVITIDHHHRFKDEVLAFKDPSGLKIELVAREGAQDLTCWSGSSIDQRYSIRGLAAPTLVINRIEKTAFLLHKLFGMKCTEKIGNRYRFFSDHPGPGSQVDLLVDPSANRGSMGVGCVHHIAWRVPDVDALDEWRRILAGQFFGVSAIQDRHYYKSIYFREPGGIQFEISTETPGFTLDEKPANLGSHLMLPEWLEPRRQSLVSVLQPLYLPNGANMFLA